jgi:diguanylate cyclase (GGDEF)-like protein/PAS domain S-box-containing protein
MVRRNKLTRFINTLTGRMVFGELLIHTILIPILFISIAAIVKDGFHTHFIDRVRVNSHLFAALLSHETSPEKIKELLDDSIFSGEVVYAEMITASGTHISGTGNLDNKTTFQEDFFFGQHGDNIYFIAVPVSGGNNNDSVLELGYDETPILDQTSDVYRWSIYLAISYILMTLLLAGVMGPQLTRSLRILRDTARRVAKNTPQEQLNVTTSIAEVASLADDLETMRKNLVEHNNRLVSREAHLRAIMENVGDGIITINENGEIKSINTSAERIFGYKADHVDNKNISILISANYLDEYRKSTGLNQSMHDFIIRHTGRNEVIGLHSDGTSFPMELTISKMPLNDHINYVVVVRDITEQRKAEQELKDLYDELEHRVDIRTKELAIANEKLEYQAFHDVLTDLPNRMLLQDRLHQAILSAHRNNNLIALFVLDLDRFKDINDTLGHHYGDLILQQVAIRLQGTLREADTVARFGGDEFAILLPVVDSLQHASLLAKKIIGAFENPFIVESQTFHIGVSIGIAVFPEHGKDNVTLMRHADVAMYIAKQNGNDISIYEPSNDKHKLNRLALMGELRHAIEHEELVLFYQPKADIKNQYVSEVEALVRWQHPSQGFMMPDDFIPFAEQTGLIIPLSLWVIKEAIRQCSAWHRKNHHYKIAVNLSAKNLHDTQLADYIYRILHMYETGPEWLVIEITESAIMSDPVRAMETLTRLHDMGIRLSIDDFGTGYSSLSYLKRLPVDEIKIDESFVVDMATNKDDLIIVRSTIDLAHNMGRSVIAEGVHSPEIWEMLVDLGCDKAQGLYISEPLSPSRLKQWHNESRWLSAAKTDRESNQPA